MLKPATSGHPVLSSKYLPLAVIGLALSILGGTIAWATNDLRTSTRQQIIRQHADTLDAVWSSQTQSESADYEAGASSRPSDQLYALLVTAQLKLPQLAGLHGTRLFDVQGRQIHADVSILDAQPISLRDLKQLRQGKPVAHFEPHVDWQTIEITTLENAPRYGALLEVLIPLHGQDNKLQGVAQFLLDGSKVADEFKTLDQNLAVQAALAFIVGGGLLVGLLGLGFRQLQHQNRLLAERTQGLLKANQELALAAKTSAVGAVTAHLIHGLKNPLSGLQTFVATRAGGGDTGDESEWQLAISSTRRMQSMIADIVGVLREEQNESAYELTLEEFVGMLEAKVLPLAREAGIHFRSQVRAEAVLTNRETNLISLILYNLIQNAIQATPRGKSVSLRIEGLNDEQLLCEVADEGPGISAAQRESLFKPCRSAKEGGSGIGLAISKQLANCIDASLELKASSPQGSTFALTVNCRNNSTARALPPARTAEHNCSNGIK